MANLFDESVVLEDKPGAVGRKGALRPKRRLILRRNAQRRADAVDASAVKPVWAPEDQPGLIRRNDKATAGNPVGETDALGPGGVQRYSAKKQWCRMEKDSGPDHGNLLRCASQ